MKRLAEKFAGLINVKTIVTFVVTGVFAVQTLRGAFSSDTVMAVVVMVLGFYFGTQHERDGRK